MKTGGRYLLSNAIVPIMDQLKKNNIETLNSAKMAHANWHSIIDNQTYIITVLRDPASQIISLYTHGKTTDSRGNPIIDKNFNLSKDIMYDEITKNKGYQNFQSKNLIFDEKTKLPIQNYEKFIDEELVEKKLNRINLLLNHNNIKENAIKIQEKIFLDLGIDGITQPPKKHPNFYNPHSKSFYDKFSNAEKDSLSLFSKIDTKLYKNANYYKM
jgi:hypothetical protein